ncbi:hypothetical protein [Campylobacter sp. RM12647]|uniref:hypothetical protein n=1 Tax=Campylobacter sp. RM12647 TaxID=2735737 RepID=UPI001D7FE0F7|nr:hypothetical protein [Campylobacter sp. RM12647]
MKVDIILKSLALSLLLCSSSLDAEKIHEVTKVNVCKSDDECFVLLNQYKEACNRLEQCFFDLLKIGYIESDLKDDAQACIEQINKTLKLFAEDIVVNDEFSKIDLKAKSLLIATKNSLETRLNKDLFDFVGDISYKMAKSKDFDIIEYAKGLANA